MRHTRMERKKTMENVNEKMNKKSSKCLEQTLHDPNTSLYFQLILFYLVAECVCSSVFRAQLKFSSVLEPAFLCFVVVCIDYLLCQQFALIISEHALQPLRNREKKKVSAASGSTHAIPSNGENHEPKWILYKVFIDIAISSWLVFLFFSIYRINMWRWMHAKARSWFRIAKFIEFSILHYSL